MNQISNDGSNPAHDVAHTAKLSDGELLARLQADSELLQRVQLAATNAHDRVRRLPFAPVQHIDLLWDGARRRTQEVKNATPSCNPNSPTDQAMKVRMLRIALDAIREFQTFANMTNAERSAALPAYKAEAELRAYNAEHAAIAARGAAALAAAPAWSAAAFIGALARKGITLSVSATGGLLATSAAQLTKAERETLVARKAAIVAELATTEMVA